MSLWTQSNVLVALLQRCTGVGAQTGLRGDLEAAVRDTKANLMAIFNFPARSSADADLVRRAESEGLNQLGLVDRLPLALVEQTLELSELTNLNEILALEYLIKAEEQLTHFPNLSRGLVAVLLFYDTRKNFASILALVAQCRSHGLTWALDVAQDVVDLIDQLNDELVEQGIVAKILNTLEHLDWEQEAVRLQSHLALGDAKHRKQVHDLFEAAKEGLAECVFALSAQRGLDSKDTIKLIDYLSTKVANEKLQMDKTELFLLFALLYAIDVGPSVKHDDFVSRLQLHPLFSSTSSIAAVHRELGPRSTRAFSHEALASILNFSWALSLATLRSINCPELISALSAREVIQNDEDDDELTQMLDEDEIVLDASLELKVFHFLGSFFLESKPVFTEDFFVRRLHSMITDFLVLMPLKTKELRNRADDAHRNALMHSQEGINYAIPLSGQHFTHLLCGMAKMYSNQPNELVLDYWQTCDNVKMKTSGYNSMRSQLLQKFVRLAGDLLLPHMYSSYVDLLAALSNNEMAALHCFNLLRTSNGLVSLQHFLQSMHNYYSSLCQMQQLQHYRRGNSVNVVQSSLQQQRQQISPLEIEGLCSVLRLLQTICYQNSSTRQALIDYSDRQCISLLFGLLVCPVPLVLKSELMLLLSAMAKDNFGAGQIVWMNLEKSQMVSRDVFKKEGIEAELEEIESRCEEYPLTRAFMKLLETLLKSRSMPVSIDFKPYLRFVRDKVFLKYSTRSYKSKEIWKVASHCIRVLVTLLEDYEEVCVEDFDEKSIRHPGFDVLVDILQSYSQTLRVLLFTLDVSVVMLESYDDNNITDDLKDASLMALRVINRALSMEENFLRLSQTVQEFTTVVTPMHELLLGVNNRTGNSDYLLIIAKFTWFATTFDMHEHTLQALQILTKTVCQGGSLVMPTFVSALSSSNEIRRDCIKAFADLMDRSSIRSEVSLAALKLLSCCLQDDRVALIHLLLGFESTRVNEELSIQPPGASVQSQRSIFHMLLHVLRNQRDCNLDEGKEELLEEGYKFIYLLVSHQRTSQAVLRYLRSVDNFFVLHLRLLFPISCEEPLKESTANSKVAMAHFLRSLAIELREVSVNGFKTPTQQLISALIGGNVDTESSGEESNELSVNSWLLQSQDQPLMMSQLSRTTFSGSKPNSGGINSSSTRLGSDIGRKKNLRLLSILRDKISFDKTEGVELPDFKIFDIDQITVVLRNCRTKNDIRRLDCINLDELRRVISSEVASGLHLVEANESSRDVKGRDTFVNRQDLIGKEVNMLMEYAKALNASECHESSNLQLFDGWRQTAEILFRTVLNDKSNGKVGPISWSVKQQLLIELVQTLLLRLSSQDSQVSTEMAHQVSSVVLMLVVTVAREFREACAANADFDNRLMSLLQQTVLKGLLLWICDSSHPRLRVNLFGALITYLQIGQHAKLMLNSYKAFRKGNLELLRSMGGEQLFDLVCRDSLQGHIIRRLLSLALMDQMLKLEQENDSNNRAWASFIGRQGYLRHLVSGLLKEEDGGLVKLLRGEVDRSDVNMMASMEIFESKMALFSRLANTANGTELLLVANLTDVLAQMNSLVVAGEQLHSNYFTKGNECIATKVLGPVLLLCSNALRSNPSLACGEVQTFLLHQEELVRETLKPSSSSFEDDEDGNGLVRCRCLLSGILAQCVQWSSSDEWGPLLSRVQRHVLANLHYSRDINIQELKLVDSVFSFAEALTVGRDNQSGAGSRVILTPSMKEALNEEHKKGSNASLGQLVVVLNDTASHIVEKRRDAITLYDKMGAIDQLGAEELLAFYPNEAVQSSPSLTERRRLIEQTIEHRIETLQNELRIAGHLLQRGITVLWKHLEHYLVTANVRASSTPFKPNLVHRQLKANVLPDNLMDGLVGSEDLSRLREHVSLALNETFFSRLAAAEEVLNKLQEEENKSAMKREDEEELRVVGRSRVNKSGVGYIDIISRRIRRIVSLNA